MNRMKTAPAAREVKLMVTDLEVSISDIREPSAAERRQTMKAPNGAVYKWVDLYDTVVDRTTYQRKEDSNHINRIKTNFLQEAVRLPTLNRRAGEKMYHIVDGQHTVQALIAKGWRYYVCEVFEGFNKDTEAKLFYLRSTGPKSITGAAKFKSAVAAGQTVECNVMKIVEGNGLSIIVNGNEPHADFAKTHGVITAIYRQKKEPHFRRFIQTLAVAFRQSKTDRKLAEPARRNEFLRGLSQFLAANPSITPKQVDATLKAKKQDAYTILDSSVTLAGECRKVRSMEQTIFKALSNIFKTPVPVAMRVAA